MEPQMIIGFAGKAGAGKDTAAQALWKFYNFQPLHFADTLKRVALTLFGFTPEQVGTAAGKAAVDPFWGITPRDALQRLGTESMRNVFGPDFWIKRLFRDLPPGRLTIADVRFPNEAQAVRDAGGKVILITRPGAGLQGAAAAHPSETALDGWPFDLEIENDGSEAQLRACVIEAAEEFFPELKP